MEKSVLYAWMSGNGFKRESVVGPEGSVHHEWTRHCKECPIMSFLSTDPGDYDSETLQAIYDQALAIVSRCGHVVTL